MLCTDVFLTAFGTTRDHLDELMAAKAVNIQRLLELLPPETIDPTPFVYNETL